MQKIKTFDNKIKKDRKGVSLRNKQGFTLIELLLYVTISSVLIATLSVFATTLLQSKIKNQTILEVESQGLYVMDLITQTIRNSEDVNSPNDGLSNGSLSLDVVSASLDPTVFDVSSGVLRMQEGVGPTVNLTNDKITVSGLNFQNLSRPGTTGTIRISFTLTRVNPSGRNEFEYTKTFYGSASIDTQ